MQQRLTGVDGQREPCSKGTRDKRGCSHMNKNVPINIEHATDNEKSIQQPINSKSITDSIYRSRELGTVVAGQL